MGAEAADIAAALVPFYVERNDAVQRRRKIADDVRPSVRRRHAQAPVQAREPRRQGQRPAALRLVQRH